jgi:hypothetical protein
MGRRSRTSECRGVSRCADVLRLRVPCNAFAGTLGGCARLTIILTRATAIEHKVARSEWEDRMLRLVRGAGLPVPICNEPFHAPDHGPCTPDFHWPGHDLIVETDGWDSHSTRAAFEDDRAKDAAPTAAGYRGLRFTWLTEDATILTRLRALLQRPGLAR